MGTGSTCWRAWGPISSSYVPKSAVTASAGARKQSGDKLPVAELLRRPPSRMEWRGWIDAATMDVPTSCSGDLWVIDTAYRRPFRRLRELHMLLRASSQVESSLGLLPIFHGITRLCRQMVELFEAVHRRPEPALRAFSSVTVSIAFVAMRCGSCDGKTWETKRMAINISLEAFLRSSRSLKPSGSCCCLAASSGCRLCATSRQSCARQRAMVE